ncbi:phosphoribosylanthranilate isomerase [Xinfangfangia sp. CPCC 101601]|uniref:N-(5'-phosphoribosyl)anthranilate isomerase n=1 Tax=Pseudogemmobacter lacusdianii TaxID=3069608 RepID=A0ABU0VX57_9RHOB|nr:phosphoribosylanthranilate isomerase [Xinfangfangia sp. CPCC 101601]MDQ2066088.1 phosphoribosylanthranilate isomerase [Xinfangfangia sp. CPCC 101601]
MAEIRVKVCGIRTDADLAAVVAAKAAYIGLNFFPKSPRFVTLEEARLLTHAAPEGLCKIGLVVDADDATLDAIVEAMPLDMLQLHGKESPDRVAEVKARYGLPVMKAVGVADEGDLAAVFDYSLVADQILVDAKAPKDAVLPGGNGLAFDWRLVAQRRWLKPWMLAGGLTPANVAEAIRLTNARQIDVASGVESAPGQKDAAKIAAFTKAAHMEKGGVPILR